MGNWPNWVDIWGLEQRQARTEVAAAGGHNVLMSGAPGAGKTLLARSIRSILSTMTLSEALEVTRIYSVADMLPPETPLISQRPFPTPSHMPDWWARASAATGRDKPGASQCSAHLIEERPGFRSVHMG